MNLKQALYEFRESIGLYGQAPTSEQMESAVAFVKSAKVVSKKISVSKKKPNGYNNSSLFHKGVWGYPRVFVESGIYSIRTLSCFHAAPFVVKWAWHDDESRQFEIKQFEINLDRPAIPQIFCEKPFDIVRNQYNSEPLGVWLVENCHELCELDRQIREAWKKQEEGFLKEAERYLDKFVGKQRELFQNKLAKEFIQNRNALADLTSDTVFELFRVAVTRPDALKSLINFCAKNRADAAFIDMSDIAAALNLAKVNEVMNK